MKRMILAMICLGLVILPAMAAQSRRSLPDLVYHESDVYAVYNDIGNTKWTRHNLDTVKALWGQNLEKRSTVPRTASDIDIIRLALANVLMQTTRQCLIRGVRMAELHDIDAPFRGNDFPRYHGAESSAGPH